MGKSDPQHATVPACRDRLSRDRLEAYCFEDLNENERRVFEAHLLDCDFCWREVVRLGQSVRVLRQGRELLRSFSPVEVGTMLGLSARLHWLLAGHTWHAVRASALYALLYCVALLIEVAYAFDSLGSQALGLLPIIFIWILGTTVGTLLLLCKSEAKKRTRGLLAPALLSVGSAILLLVALYGFLPGVPITQAKIQTYSAQAAYLKWVAYGIPSLFLFLLLPFQCVVRLQAEVETGAHAYVLAILAGEKRALPPAGVVVVRPWVLWTILIAALVYSLAAGSHLLDNLLPSRFTNLFVILVQVRWCLYLAFGVECLAWYNHALRELHRECIILENLQP